MNIKSIDMSNFDLVEVKNGTPHCNLHGAMNKVSLHADGGGYWRCITVISNKSEGVCRAGCEQINLIK